MVSVWLNEKELQIIKDCLATLGDSYWIHYDNEDDVINIKQKIFNYWFDLSHKEELLEG